MKRIQVQFPEPTLGGSLLPVTSSRGLDAPFCPPPTHLHSHAPSNRRHTHTADICALRSPEPQPLVATVLPGGSTNAAALGPPVGRTHSVYLCVCPLSVQCPSSLPSVSGTAVSPFLLGTVLLLKLEKYKLIELIGLMSYFFS